MFVYYLERGDGVSFINVKCTNFSYETSFFGSFSSYVSALAPKFHTKNARVNIDEIDTWSQQWENSNTLIIVTYAGKKSFYI